ncbi:MAG: DUF3667 domain-containing protein [Candidatus Marinimicrobia bacterium]|nr:DUF3667 domain-containing protein [Candidatus Neomarinimicrobiota bacterium]
MMNDQPINNCSNCGTELQGEYCHECGQSAREYKTSVKQIIRDFFATYFTVDSKLFRSIIPLLFKPGFLVNKYLAGKRVRFIRPLRMYLFSSLIFFAFISFSNNANVGVDGMGESTDAVTDSVKQETGDALSDFSRGLESALDDTALSDRNSVQDTIAADSTEGHDNSILRIRNNPDDPSGNTIEVEFNALGISRESSLDHNSIIRTAVDSISVMMFLLLPLFAAILKLIYIRSGRLYVEHLVFVLYNHSFVFLLMTPLMLIETNWVELPLIILVLVYLYISMRTVYTQSHLKTVFKYFLLMFAYLIILFISYITTFLGMLLINPS